MTGLRYSPVHGTEFCGEMHGKNAKEKDWNVIITIVKKLIIYRPI